METAIITFNPSTSLTMNDALNDMRRKLAFAALANVEAAGEGFTTVEREAMAKIEQLKLINDLDLAAVLMRGELLHEIEERALWSVHPGQYGSLQEMARMQGISLSELSNTRDLYDVIFPYMEQVLGIPIPQIWEEIGKSNFRELVPVLKALITGEEPATASTRDTLNALLDNTAASNHAAGIEVNDAALRRQVAEGLIADGQVMTNRQLRTRLRPERTEPIQPTILRQNGTRILLAELSEDQWTAFQRRLNSFMDEAVVDLPNDPQLRAREVASIPTVRRIVDFNFLILGRMIPSGASGLFSCKPFKEEQ